MTRVVLRIASLLLLAATARAQTATIELLDPGAEPRALLRYKFTPGSLERGTMEMSISLLREANGQYVPMVTMPPTRMTMELRVTEVASDGTARVEMATRSAEADVDQATSGGPGGMNSALATVSRLGGWYTMDTRGRTTAAEAVLHPTTGAQATAPGADRALQFINNEMPEASMFPEEPVGKGARWRVTTNSPIATLDANTAAEYTLVSRQGNRIELDMKMGVIASGNNPDGTFVATGVAATGHSVVDLDKLVHTMTMQADSQMPGPAAAGQAAGPGMRMQMRMTMSPATN